MYLLYSLQGHGEKNDAEVIEYGGKIWINQGELGKNLDIANIADRTQHYSDEFKKMRCEIQECGKYQPRRMFTENTLAVEITTSAVKAQAVIFREKFGVNQHDSQSTITRFKTKKNISK